MCVPRGRYVAVLLCALGFVCAGTARAQSVGSISGTITDSSGAAVPGAQVTALNEGTAVTRTAPADEEGRFVLSAMPIGSYTVSIKAGGFKPVEKTHVTLEIQQNLILDIKLTLASLSAEVQVTGEAPEVQVQRSDASLGQLIHSEQVSELPLNGRNFVQLAWLGTGTVRQQRPGSFLNAGGTSEVSFRGSVSLSSQGMRENANDWLYDGVDNNELTAGGVGFLPSIDAINEFKVMTYNFSPQYGARAGTTVVVSSKSGTNQFHGTVFEFLRNDVLDARNFFDGPKKGKYIQNEYGASLGGPLKRDKTFFFADFQVNGVRQGLTSLNTVPSAAIHNGDFSELLAGSRPIVIYDPSTTAVVAGVRTRRPFANNIIPASRINPIAKQLLDFLPLPNNPGSASNYLSNPVKVLDDAQWDARLDHSLSSSDQIFARFSWDNAYQFLPDGLPGFGSPGAFSSNQTFRTHARHIAISESHIFAPTVVSQFTAGYNRVFNYIQSYGYGTNMSQRLGIPGANLGAAETSSLTQISLTNYAGLGDRQFSPFQGGTNVYHYTDTLNVVRGKHAFLFGFGFRAMQENTLGNNALAGTFTFNQLFTSGFDSAGALLGNTTGNTIASFLLGLPAAGGRNDQANGYIRGRRWKEYRGFAGDTWKFADNLTFDLGLAYAVTTPISETANRYSNMDFSTGTFFVAGQGADKYAGVKTDFSNIEPRFGFAWTPWQDKKSVLRGGYGIYHDTGATGGTAGLYQNPPYAAQYNFFSDSITAVRTLSTGFPVNDPTVNIATYGGVIRAQDPDFKQGLIQQWNFNIQRELPGSTVLTVAYTRTHGTRLSLKQLDYNTATPGPGNNPASRRRYPQYNQILNTVSAGWLSYHSLQVKAERRAGRSLYLLASYTYSKALSNGLRQEITGDPGVSYFPILGGADRGLASTDLRHNFALSYLYSLPFGRGKKYLSGLNGVGQAILGGWDLNGVTLLHSGFGLGMNVATNQNGTSLGNRPNQVCSGNLSNPSPTRWFDTSCFTAPAVGVFGNAGRSVGGLYGPDQVNFDVSLYKTFPVTERLRVQFRTELFNAFNHAQFATPNTTFGNPNFGRITSTINSSRQMQFALKFVF
jgi:Carboxypeptidase regulatory-like domain